MWDLGHLVESRVCQPQVGNKSLDVERLRRLQSLRVFHSDVDRIGIGAEGLLARPSDSMRNVARARFEGEDSRGRSGYATQIHRCSWFPR